MSREKEKQLEAEDKRAIARAETKLHNKTFPNQYPGICSACGKQVAAQQGYWSKKKVFCEGCGSELLNSGP
jgi:DNA-directed RNA polymerase subunit RPC12/RpoP